MSRSLTGHILTSYNLTTTEQVVANQALVMQEDTIFFASHVLLMHLHGGTGCFCMLHYRATAVTETILVSIHADRSLYSLSTDLALFLVIIGTIIQSDVDILMLSDIHILTTDRAVVVVVEVSAIVRLLPSTVGVLHLGIAVSALAVFRLSIYMVHGIRITASFTGSGVRTILVIHILEVMVCHSLLIPTHRASTNVRIGSGFPGKGMLDIFTRGLISADLALGMVVRGVLVISREIVGNLILAQVAHAVIILIIVCCGYYFATILTGIGVGSIRSFRQIPSVRIIRNVITLTASHLMVGIGGLHIRSNDNGGLAEVVPLRIEPIS